MDQQKSNLDLQEKDPSGITGHIGKQIDSIRQADATSAIPAVLPNFNDLKLPEPEGSGGPFSKLKGRFEGFR